MSLPAFVSFLKAKKLSRKTIRNYRSDVSQFLAWLAPQSLGEVGSQHFASYKLHLESHRSKATLTRHLSALRKFAQFLNLPVALDNPPLPLVPTIAKNFQAHLVKHRYQPKTIANYLSDIRHYLTWAQNHV